MTEEQKSDLRYIKDPMLWVQILCPLKRTTKSLREIAYMSGDGPNLHHGSMFNAKATDRVKEFKSFEAIIEAGWKVD